VVSKTLLWIWIWIPMNSHRFAGSESTALHCRKSWPIFQDIAGSVDEL
jgi:hypothetical protein